MAAFYFDQNSTNLGFGTLTRQVNDSNPCLGSTNNLGTSIAGTLVSGSTANTYSFGSAATSTNTTPGTFTFQGTGTFTANGIIYQNLTGNQTWTKTTGTGALTLGGTSPFIEVTATGKLIFSVFALQGTVNWEKRGASILQLNAANTFSGGMTIAAGTVEIGNASALGTGTVTMTGGKLSSSSGTGYGLANALTLNGTMTLGDATNNGVNTFSGTLTVSGASTLTAATAIGFYGSFQGSGNLSLGGNNFFFTGASSNTYSGALTLTSGGLFLANFNSGTPNQLGTTSSLTFNSDLQVLGNTAYTFANAIGGTGIVYVRNTSVDGITFNGSMASYTGPLRAYADSAEGANPVQKVTLTRADQFGFGSFWFQSGGGLTTLSQTLTYTGSANVSADTYLSHYAVSASPTAVFQHYGTGGATVTFTNASKWFSNDNTVDFALKYDVGPSAGLLTVAVPYKEFFTGKFSFEKLGVGPMTLSGDNQISKTFTVSAGTLNANSATAMGQSSTTAAISVTSGATLSLGAAATYASRSLTIGGTGVASTVGALVIANAGTSAFQSITLTAPTYIRATASGLLNAPFTSANYNLTLGATAGVDFFPFGSSLARVFSGTGSMTYGAQASDSGTVLTGTSHNYTGNTTLAYGTVYVYSASELPGTEGPLGRATTAGSLLMTGGTLFYANGSYDYSSRFSTAGSQQWKINTGASAVTFATNLVGASSLSLLGGALTLTGSSTFSSGVTLAGGTLNAGAAETVNGFGVSIAGPLGLTGAIAFTGGTLQYSSVNQFDYSFRFSTAAGQSFKIDTNGQDVTFSSVLTSAGGSLAKSGTGKLTLGVANSYSNGSTLTNGTLKCNNAASLGTGGLAQSNGTTLHVATVDGKMTITGAHTNTGTGSRTIRIGA
jgi:autotransporter-associated beta strand protein